MSLKDKIVGLFGKLTKPSLKFSILSLVTIGVFVGVLGVIGFEVGMGMTNTEEFCTDCHKQPGATAETWYTTAHYKNRTGVRPICSDCHVPKSFSDKMWRKVVAVREVASHMMGTIDTTEKYLANVQHMRENEIKRLKANDSQECRSCHEVEQMDLELQTAKAREFHSVMKSQGKTCIDCHQGIAHMSPAVEAVVGAAH